MRTATFLPILLWTWTLGTARAQTRADVSSTMFSDGVHPTFAVGLMGTDTRTVYAYWKEVLKGVSIKVTDKKEVIGATARIPTISPDTVRIYVKAEQPKGSALLMAHVSIKTTSGFIGPDSPERELIAARAYVEQNSVVLKRRIAQTILDQGRKKLSTLGTELSQLQREKTRLEENIDRTKRKDAEALTEQERGEAELPILVGKLDLLREQARTAPSEQTEKELRSAEREQTKLQDRIRRAGNSSVAAKKKVTDLEWEVKKNLKDQEAKQVEVGKQEELVKELERNVAAVN